MTREETAQLLAMMQAQWTNHAMPDPEATVMSYWIGLDDIPAEAAMQAFRSHLKDPARGRYFPNVADLRAGLPPMPMIAALPSGARREPASRFIFRLYDADLDDYVDLTEPVPFSDPRYDDLVAQDRAAIQLAGARRRGEAA